MKKLKVIVDFLKGTNLNLSRSNSDGRVNSILNEDEILNIIDKKFDIKIPESRNWADFYLDDLPVNIKITTTTTNDNASSKKGIYFALTGNIYVGSESWDSYLKKLSNDIKENDKDYYFLVINKDNPKEIFFNSLKKINKLVPNGNNPPFQINWGHNKIMKDKTFLEAKEMILETMGKSLKQRANAYNSFKKYFFDINI